MYGRTCVSVNVKALHSDLGRIVSTDCVSVLPACVILLLKPQECYDSVLKTNVGLSVQDCIHNKVTPCNVLYINGCLSFYAGKMVFQLKLIYTNYVLEIVSIREELGLYWFA